MNDLNGQQFEDCTLDVTLAKPAQEAAKKKPPSQGRSGFGGPMGRGGEFGTAYSSFCVHYHEF